MRTITIYFCFVLFLFTSLSKAQEDIQRVRVDFENPEGYTRHLLLGFMPDNSASDGFDYGYDALNIENLPDDLNWIIENDRYVIQGVGAFSADKYYPLGMFLNNSGNVTISLAGLENFEETINVYLYDLELDTYTLLNIEDYNNNLAAENYLDRFFITFAVSMSNIIGNSVLSIFEDEITDVKVWHSKIYDELHIKGVPNKNNVVFVSLLSLDGKYIFEENINYNAYDNEIMIGTNGFSEGVYFLKIDSASFSHISKVCIAN